MTDDELVSMVTSLRAMAPEQFQQTLRSCIHSLGDSDVWPGDGIAALRPFHPMRGP